jgi:hypothetical protein
MKAFLIIIILSAVIGLSSVAWLVLLVITLSKKVKNKEVLKRWLRMHIVLVSAYLLLVAGCSPGELVGTGYLVSVTQQGQTTNHRVDTRAEADSIYREAVGADLMGELVPFFEVKNSEVFIYVEEKGIYQRRPDGKRRWRVYVEELKLK